MYYCETSDRRVCFQNGLFDRMKDDLHRNAERFGQYLRVIVTPEPSGPGHTPPPMVRPRWLGAVKTLFWTANSIILGILLAAVCN